jgi:hypothetical protein
MAMSGVPVIVSGRTHYREKGFTIDPQSWDEYFKTLEDFGKKLSAHRLSEKEIETAWHYAYSFFFEYPQPFPWHLLHFDKAIQDTSLTHVFDPEGQQEFGRTFDLLLGDAFDWDAD